jgi:DNA (cytosine-5)-methyltransferase 1
MSAYYNEIEPYPAQWIRNLIKEGLLPDGEVDERSILDVQPDELRGFTQCHFFAGIGGWAYAARLAGWPDDRPLWTGSAPCQPFSVAGKGKAQEDERHLWPVFFELIRACRPPVLMGEQVAAAVGKDWLDGVCADLEGVGYACGATVVPACAVDAPHRRDRLWFVGNADISRTDAHTSTSASWHPVGKPSGGDVANAVRGGSGAQRRNDGEVRGVQEAQRWAEHSPLVSGRGGDANSPLADANNKRRDGIDALLRPEASGWHSENVHEAAGGGAANDTFWSEAVWVAGADGKARRVKPGVRLLAHGVPTRVGKLRAYGNAIVPILGAEVIRAYLETEGAK